MATPKIDRYFEQVRKAGGACPETKARHIGETPELLEELLRDTATLLVREYRSIFKGARFDFAGRRLIAKDDTHALVWTLRKFADKPESEHNQQTSLGYVAVYRTLEEYGRHR